MRTRRKPHNGKRKRMFIGITCLIVGIVFSVAERAMTPIVEKYICQRAEQITANIVNSTMAEWNNCTPYTELLCITRDTNGNIEMVQSDAIEINQMQTALNTVIQQKLNELHRQAVQIPLGTLIGGNLLRERGPKITARFAFASSVQCALENQLQSAGINQTRHEVWLNVHVNVYAMVPFVREAQTITVRFCLAQTVIVGKVPDVYLSQI